LEQQRKYTLGKRVKTIMIFSSCVTNHNIYM
jgi:hypothetical protein